MFDRRDTSGIDDLHPSFVDTLSLQSTYVQRYLQRHLQRTTRYAEVGGKRPPTPGPMWALLEALEDRRHEVRVRQSLVSSSASAEVVEELVTSALMRWGLCGP